MVRQRINNPVRFFTFLFLLVLAGSCLAEQYPAGDSLLDSYQYLAAINYFDSVSNADTTSCEAAWKLAMSLNLFAELVPKDDQLAYYERAETAAEHAIALDSTEAEGHFQLARALGKIALFKGVFKSIGLAKRVKQEAEITLELNPNHDGAYHILGRWNREVAQKPKFLRVPMGLGSANKDVGLEMLKKAVELRPNFIHHHLEYGISLLDKKRKDEARQQFQICLELVAHGPLDAKYQEEAKEYLAKLD
jgi:tetratricopeptide (TPR) repeat protein